MCAYEMRIEQITTPKAHEHHIIIEDATAAMATGAYLRVFCGG
jgi:hypothetical protein